MSGTGKEDRQVISVKENQENVLPTVLTVEDISHILQIGRNNAYALVRSRAIRSIHIGRQIRIPREALTEFLSA